MYSWINYESKVVLDFHWEAFSSGNLNFVEGKLCKSEIWLLYKYRSMLHFSIKSSLTIVIHDRIEQPFYSKFDISLIFSQILLFIYRYFHFNTRNSLSFIKYDFLQIFFLFSFFPRILNSHFQNYRSIARRFKMLTVFGKYFYLDFYRQFQKQGRIK